MNDSLKRDYPDSTNIWFTKRKKIR